MGTQSSEGDRRRCGVGLAARAPEYGSNVPRVSAFYGIVIAMYFGEHGVPHVHARYAGGTGLDYHRNP